MIQFDKYKMTWEKEDLPIGNFLFTQKICQILNCEKRQIINILLEMKKEIHNCLILIDIYKRKDIPFDDKLKTEKELLNKYKKDYVSLERTRI